MPTCPSSSSSAASILRGGEGQSQKRLSNFFQFVGMKLLWDDINNIIRKIWLNRHKGVF